MLHSYKISRFFYTRKKHEEKTKMKIYIFYLKEINKGKRLKNAKFL